MSDEVQESRVIPWGTKLTPTEIEIVREVARRDNTSAAELIRNLALPIIRERYEKIRREDAGALEEVA